MSYFIKGQKWINVNDSYDTIKKKITNSRNVDGLTLQKNNLILHQEIKPYYKELIQDEAILPKIFSNEYKSINDLINKYSKNDNSKLIFDLFNKVNSLNNKKKSLNDIDKLTALFSKNNVFLNSNNNKNTIVNPLNSIIKDWELDNSNNLFESSYTFLYENLFVGDFNPETYGCISSSSSVKREKLESKIETMDSSNDENKKVTIKFQKDYSSVCEDLANLLNNLMNIRIINLNLPLLAPIYGKKKIIEFIYCR